jgi:hypothetical protein
VETLQKEALALLKEFIKMSHPIWKIEIVVVQMKVLKKHCVFDRDDLRGLFCVHPFILAEEDLFKGCFMLSSDKQLQLTERSKKELETMKGIWQRYLNCNLNKIKVSQPLVAVKRVDYSHAEFTY